MSRTDLVGRMTRLLMSACVVPAGLGLSILQAQAGGMPGVSRNEAPCGDTAGGSASRSAGGSSGGSAGGSSSGSAGGSASRSACDCLHCRNANSSDSRLRRFFRSHCHKWSQPIPHDSWRCYHPCPPYFQPTFGVHQTSWGILPQDACQVPFTTSPIYSSDHPASDMELHPSLPPTPPEAEPAIPLEAKPDIQIEAKPETPIEAKPQARRKAIPSRVTTASAENSAGFSRRHVEQQAVVPASKKSEKHVIPEGSASRKPVSRADSQRRPQEQAEKNTVPRATRSPQLAPLSDVPISFGTTQAEPDRSVPTEEFVFDKRTPDSLFTPHNDPIFRTKPAAGPRVISHLE